MNWPVIYPRYVVIIGLLVLGVLMAASTIFTSSTANILAWGFHGLDSIDNSLLVLLAYEFSHSSPAHTAFLFGLWVLMAQCAVRCFTTAGNLELAMKQFRGVFGAIILTVLLLFISLNSTMMQFPTQGHYSRYIDKILSPLPYAHQLPVLWLFLVPGLLTVVGCVTAVRKSIPSHLWCL